MLENVLTVGNYVLILFVLIGVGFVCNKTRILTKVSIKDFTNLILYIVTPCVIVNSYLREFDSEMLKGLIITIAGAIVSFAISIILAHLLVHDNDKRREKTLRFGAVFSNCGYMSLPLQSAMLGDVGVFYGATFVAVFQVVLWTYGVWLMSGDSKSISIKKILINPGVISTVIGVVIFVFSINIPAVLGEPIKFLAALNTPVPMIIVGFHLAGANLKINGVPTVTSIFLRLIVAPLIMIGGMYLCGITGTVLISSVIAVSAPFAAATTMFAEKFDGDTALSSTTVSVTTLLSIITMPLIVGIAAML